MTLIGESTHPVANSVRNWVAVSLVWQGRWEEAERVAVESARIAENTQALLLLVVCRAAAGFARWARTGNAAGLQQLRDAVNGLKRGVASSTPRFSMVGWSKPAPRWGHRWCAAICCTCASSRTRR